MQIPDTARDFVDTLRPIRKPATCHSYIYGLRSLHAWLSSQKLSLGALDRGIMERWLSSLADRGLAPSSRNLYIYHVRKYLEWLFERGTVIAHPDDLLRSSDLPDIPSTLPRPFPKEVDRELQQRFRASENLYAQALFLMRHSGVRIGELVHLETACLERDLHGHPLLKVPLGKLNNDRRVPLSDETSQLLERLQKIGPIGGPFLLAPHLSRVTVKNHVRETLKTISLGLDISGPVIPHRLRHTYATELLNAGMSLVAIMKLLGHRSIHMTMRYAAFTQNTLVRDYHFAMAKIVTQYQLPDNPSPIAEPDPQRLLLDIISWLRKNAPEHYSTHRLIKRIYKIQNDIARLKN
jgi:site-specific recombinase XerD